MANRLLHESSLYLQQHAHNPVHWYPWSEEALTKAKQEQKLILLSIGYSACHWCHVMEKESFENEEVAQVMNANFISIKLDREERPDIDSIYMEAIQSMGLVGGWPLHVVLTPDQKPFYGGTYFPKDDWIEMLLAVSETYTNNKEEIEKSAESFKTALQQSLTDKYQLDKTPTANEQTIHHQSFDNAKRHFDTVYGGQNRSPKFPMPSVYLYFLRYYFASKDPAALQHVQLTLDQMALGGIYDQIGGGFSRYATDVTWHVPHFEKMLYDNAQLLSLYSEAYQITKKPLYKDVIEEVIAFLNRELLSPSGAYYAALDADTEGNEGKYYCWTSDELKILLGKDYVWFAKYYNIQELGNWEDHKNILHCPIPIEEFCIENNIAPFVLKTKIQGWKKLLLDKRTERIAPGLDTKTITCWNGLLIKGLTDAYLALGNEEYVNDARRISNFIINDVYERGILYRIYSNGTKKQMGFLDDYAAVIDGFINLYQCTFEQTWINLAKELTDYTLQNFFDIEENLFYFTDVNANQLISRKKELFDNVIPSSNSIMCHNLILLSKYYYRNDYEKIAKKMLAKVVGHLGSDIYYLSNWGINSLLLSKPIAEIAIVGKDFKAFAKTIQSQYYPHKVLAATALTSDLPILDGKTGNHQTNIYHCSNQSCHAPLSDIDLVWKLLE